MYRSLLLLLGLLFLSLALLGTGYLYFLGIPQELHGFIAEEVVATEPPTSTEPPVGITEGAIEPTDTPAPTATPPDTPTPIPSATIEAAATEPFGPQTYCVQSPSTNNIIVRSGPGRQYPPLGDPLPVGTCLVFSAQNEESTWLLIAGRQPNRDLQQYEGGWIARQLLGLGISDPIDLPVVTLTPTPFPKLPHFPVFTPTGQITINRPLQPALSFQPVALPIHAGPRSWVGSPSADASSDNFQIEANWPHRMEVSGSGTIRVTLVRTEQGLVPTIQTNGETPVVFTPIAVGTPGQNLGVAFGEGYRAKRAIARIAGASFDIQPVLPAERQSLEQPQIVWTWNISSATVAKNQAVDLTIQIEWERQGDPSDVKNPVIWREHMDILVFQPFLKAGQVSAMSLVSAFVGSGLSIPWLYEKLSKRKPASRKKTTRRTS